MKSLRSILVIALMTLFMTTGFAQKASKLTAKATEKVESLNKQIMAGDEAATLSMEQKKSIAAVYTQMFKDLRAAKKEGADKEAVKAVRKAANKKINQEILTKTQRKAKKAGKEKDKE